MEVIFVMKMAISDFLVSLRIMPSLKGFPLICSAVVLLIAEPTTQMKSIYSTLAKEYGATVSSVERNIRSAKESAIKNGLLRQPALFGAVADDMEHLKNAEFLHLIRLAFMRESA